MQNHLLPRTKAAPYGGGALDARIAGGAQALRPGLLPRGRAGDADVNERGDRLASDAQLQPVLSKVPMAPQMH